MRLIQNNFNAGEWSPLMEGRTDLDRYKNSLHRSDNFLLDPRGPLSFCPGFKYIAGTKTNSKKSVLMPFRFSATQAYQLEFGDQYIRFYKNQAQILSGANPYEVASPYLEADLSTIYYFQSADVIYLLHPNYAPRKLSRAGDTDWALSTINFQPPALSEQGESPNATLTPGATTGTSVTFTAGSSVFLSGDVGRLIIAGVGRASITAFTSGTQVVCDILDDFSSTDPIAAGDWTMLGSTDGNVGLSASSPVGSIVTLTGTDSSEAFTDLLGVDTNYWTASGSGTNEYYLNNGAPMYSATEPTNFYIEDVQSVKGVLGTLGIHQYGWGDNDALGYNTLYVRLSDGTDPDIKSTAAAPDEDYLQKSIVSGTKDLFRSTDVGNYIRIYSGLVKITVFTSAQVVKGVLLKEATDTTATTAWYMVSDDWSAINGYPSCGAIYEERMVLAGSTAYPDTFWGSVVGDYENFTPGASDSDSYTYTLGGGQVDSILWVDPREYLMVGTSAAEWLIWSGSDGAPLTPTNIKVKQERQHGSSRIKPVTTEGATLFSQRASRRIRELAYRWEDDSYSAPDMTLLAEHITSGVIKGMTYQQDPLSTIWVWMEDGTVAMLTYLRDQEVVGWGNRDLGGQVESMSVIPGDGYDEVWAIIKRTVNGSTVRYVEMMETVFNDSPAEFAANKGLNAFFLDSGITYTGVATKTITGLDHLEGETVNALVDGSAVTGLTVAGGQVTIPISATVVHVGLPYSGIAQLPRIDVTFQNGSTHGYVKKINSITLRVVNSGACKAGPSENDLVPVYDKERDIILGAAYPLFTGDIEIGYDGPWDKEARPMIVQDLPLPLTLIAVMPEISFS